MNKKTVLILCIVLAVLLSGAAVLYNSLSGGESQPGLMIQTPETTQPPQTEPAPETHPEETVPETTQPQVYPAPDFTVLDWEGNERTLSEFIGKPVILNFWASWCGPCKSEMPDLEEAYQTYGEDIHFLMVNCVGGRETVESAKAFIEDAGYTFPVYFDTTYEAASLYGASSIPLTYFVDAQGNLAAYYMGAMSSDILGQGISLILPKQ